MSKSIVVLVVMTAIRPELSGQQSQSEIQELPDPFQRKGVYRELSQGRLSCLHGRLNGCAARNMIFISEPLHSDHLLSKSFQLEPLWGNSKSSIV